MFRPLSKILLLSLCAWLLTGPLAVLQLGAWGWMLASYTQESSFEQAIVETFGDERPCSLCRVIDAVETNETGDDSLRIETKDIKLMLGLGRAIDVKPPLAAYRPSQTPVCEPKNVHWPVPTPPPRVA